MPHPIILLWLVSIVALWGFVVRGFLVTVGTASAKQQLLACVAFLCTALPPTAIFLVSIYVLRQAAPTVQYNVGSEQAMDWWSFWVHWWPTIFSFSGLQNACYLVWFVWALIGRRHPSVRHAVGFALLSSVLGSVLLNMASPRA
jgi:hypothetical protein